MLEVDTESHACALLYGAMGLVHIAASDPEDKALGRLTDTLRRLRQ